MKQTLTVRPSTVTGAGATVHLAGAGFTPGEALVVTECAVKGTTTGPGDCNLAKLKAVSADANGRVELDYEVVRGPFGANNIVCGPHQGCLVSITQATLKPTEEADATVSFR